LFAFCKDKFVLIIIFTYDFHQPHCHAYNPRPSYRIVRFRPGHYSHYCNDLSFATFQRQEAGCLYRDRIHAITGIGTFLYFQTKCEYSSRMTHSDGGTELLDHLYYEGDFELKKGCTENIRNTVGIHLLSARFSVQICYKFVDIESYLAFLNAIYAIEKLVW